MRSFSIAKSNEEQQLIEPTEDNKQKKLNTGTIFNIIPLIVGIIVTTSISVIIIIFLSSFWAEQSGYSLIQQEISNQNALCTFIGNSIQQIIQKVSDARSQILIQLMQSFTRLNISYANPIYNSHTYSMANIISGATSISNVPYYDPVTKRSQMDVLWGLVSSNGILNTIYTETYQLQNLQSYTLKIFCSTLPMIQTIFIGSNLYFDYIFIHSVDQVMMYYPVVQNPCYNCTLLQEMQSNYKLDNKNLYTISIVNSSIAKSQICSAIIYKQSFKGILCIGFYFESVQQKLNYFGKQFKSPISMYTVLADSNLTTITSSQNIFWNITNGTTGQQWSLQYNFPNLLQLLFQSSSSTDANQFIDKFGGMFYTNSNKLSSVLYSNNYTNNFKTYYANVREINAVVNGDLNKTSTQKIINLMIQLYYESIYQTFQGLSQEQQNYSLKQILGLAVPFALAICSIAWCFAYSILQEISNPIEDLIYKLNLLSQDTLKISVYSNFKQSSYEINQLYEIFHQLITVLNFSNPRYFEGDDAELLMKFSQGLLLFQGMNSNRGIGVNFNNIANIHRKNGRYVEAIQCYRESLQICETDLLAQTKLQRLEQVFPILEKKFIRSSLYQTIHTQDIDRKDLLKPKPTSTDMLYLQKIKDKNPLPPDKIIDAAKDQKELVEYLIETYNNRNYNLANTLIEYGQIQKDLTDKESDNIYRESIERLDLTLYHDTKENINQSREITACILLSRAYLETHSHEVALKYIDKVKELIEDYEMSYENFISQNLQHYIHPSILKQRAIFQKGEILMRKRLYQQAARLFTESLEAGKFYDPVYRLKSLQNLDAIFRMRDIIDKVPNLTKMLNTAQSKKNIDIVFVMDFSESMQNEKKKFAIDGILRIFDDYLQNDDRIAFMRFNQNLNVIFELTEKGENIKFLRRSIEKSLDEHAKGETAMLQAILYSLEIFKKAIEKDHQKWIVVLTDGEDNISRISAERMKKMLNQSPNISLIVVGIALPEEAIAELTELCRFTKEGLFIQSVDSEDLHIEFQALTNALQRQLNLDYTVEYLTH